MMSIKTLTHKYTDR